MKAKKIISIAIAIMMIVALAVPAFADAQYAVNLGVDSKIKTGTDFTVTIKVTTPELSNGVGFILTFDHTKMTYKSYACSVANCNVTVIEDGKLELVSSMDAKQYNDETWMTITFTAGNDEATNVEFTTLYSDDVTFMNADADVVEANDISFGTATTDIVVPHTAPVINGLAISGDGQVGNALTASYTSVTDNWNLTPTVAYTWTIDGAAVTGTVSADGTQYTPVAADIGKTVTVSAVATVSDDSLEQGDTTTTSAAATATKAITANTTAAAGIDGDVTFDTATMAVGVPVTATYTFAPSVNAGDDASTFVWKRDGEAIEGATDKTYTPTMDDFGKTLSVEVTPKGSNDTVAGEAKTATATAAVIAGNMKPEIADLKIVKDGAEVQAAVVGDTLEASYTFKDLDADGNDNAETDASEFVWLRDGEEIEGATEKTYTLTADDRDAEITVKVIAKSTDATPNTNLNLSAEDVVLGNELTSDAVAVSKNADLKPTVEITKAPKSVKVKNEAKVNYTFIDENGFGDESTALFRVVDKNGEPVDNVATIKATVDAENGIVSAKIDDTKLAGKYIVCEITPVNDDEPAVEGDVVKSAVIQVTSAKSGYTSGSTGPSLVSSGTSTTDPTTITDPDDPNANLPDAIKNADKGCIILVIGEKKASVFGEIKENDVAPQIVNDRTMLPCRFVAEGLGAEVDWDDSTKTVIITKGDLKIELTIGKDFAIVNGEELPLDSPAFIENDRTFTPIRFIAEALNAQVDWEEATKTVTITPKD